MSDSIFLRGKKKQGYYYWAREEQETRQSLIQLLIMAILAFFFFFYDQELSLTGILPEVILPSTFVLETSAQTGTFFEARDIH